AIGLFLPAGELRVLGGRGSRRSAESRHGLGRGEQNCRGRIVGCGCALGGEAAREPRPSAPQDLPETVSRTTADGRRLVRGEAAGFDEHQGFALLDRKLGERCESGTLAGCLAYGRAWLVLWRVVAVIVAAQTSIQPRRQ